MKRQSESEITERKRQRAAAVAAAPPSDDAAASSVVPYDRLLDQLRRAVDRQYTRSPHLAAFEEFHLEDSERADALSSRAAELFEQIRQQDSSDPLALHHLAVIHHGTGYRMYLDKPDMAGEAISHWKKGLQAWAELVRDDAFWNTLRARWEQHLEKNPDDLLTQRLLQVNLNTFRHHIPNYLLNLHAAIVREHFQTDLDIAQAHLGVILESRFDAVAVENARRRLFEDLVGNVQDMCKSLRFDEARGKAERYVGMDEDYVPALCSVLKTCCAECKHLSANANHVERRRGLLQACEKYATHGLLRQQADHDLWAAEALRDFYLQGALAEFHGAKACGDSRRRNAGYDRALEWIKQAVAFERCGQKARELFQVICFAGAMDDINSEGSDRKLARRLLDAGLAAMPRDPELVAVNAYYYLRQGDEKRFRDELRNAETCNAAANNSNAANIIARLHEVAREDGVSRQVQDLMDKAMQAMRRQDFRAALRHWNTLETLAGQLPEELVAIVYFQKVQCELLTHDLSNARRSYQKARQHASPAVPHEMRKALDEWESLFQ